MASQGAQDHTDRLKIRQSYRRLQEGAANNSEVLTSIGSGALQQTLNEVNELQKLVTKPREHALDASLFCQLTEAGFKATEKLVSNQNGRSVHDMVIALRSNYVHTSRPQEDGCEDPNAFSWEQLSRHVARWFKLAPGANCMLGPLDVQAKVRKVVQRQGKRPTGEVVRPEELEQIQEQEKQETDRNMEEMWEILRALQSCPVAELICNHHCFAQTIENLFTLSFLVRDQRAYLYHEAAQGMMVCLVDRTRPAPQQAGKRPDEQLQFVMAVTMEDWELMKRVVSPDQTKMRHRDQSAVMALNIGAARRQQQQQEAGPSSGPTAAASQPASKKSRKGH